MKSILCVLLFAIPAFAQKPFPINDQVGLRIVPRIYPKTDGLAHEHMEMKKDGPIHRVLRDSSGRILFAYDIEVKSSDGQYHIVTEPVNAAYAQTLQTEPVPTLSSVSDSASMLGGSVMIELLSNPTTGQKILDDIKLVDITTAGAAPDGMLHIEYADLYSNGAKLPHGSISGGAVGPQFVMYLEGSGGFFFSLLQPAEYPQFQKVGIIEGSRLKFVWNNRSYELRTTGPILSTGASAEVWVFHDPQFRPKTAGAGPIQWGAESAMKMWLGKEEDEN
jgi:hypothetical protein